MTGDPLTVDEIGCAVRAFSDFKWLPGMRERDGDRVWDLHDGEPLWGGSDHRGDPGTMPDMSDAQTVHAVILLARLVHGDPTLYTICHEDNGTETWWWQAGDRRESGAMDWWLCEAGAALGMLREGGRHGE